MTTKEFSQVVWDEETIDDCRQIIRLAVREDLGQGYDLTTLALVAHDARGIARVVSRESGVVAGLRPAELALVEMNTGTTWHSFVAEGDSVHPGQALAEVSGSTRDILTAERLILNLIGRMSGIATLTRRYVDAVASTNAHIYDTRKTTPGWRRLEKYAVTCGGGHNHRTGLFDAVLIKDNHIAHAAHNVSRAIEQARDFLAKQDDRDSSASAMIEVEVDTLKQLQGALAAKPDIVLLDNMSYDELRHAVAMRDATDPAVELEASGGINLQTVADVAACGVDRISVGALTHSAVSLDVGLDWADVTS
ncbi:MAG: nicotinate-nucleotide diphosphorylase (carboxylating) [Planctomycetaceae bacterium]|nr:nicotinate-nucleotide diphosphorylase (carboxylating) [Planctomycetaceae bacterium]